MTKLVKEYQDVKKELFALIEGVMRENKFGDFNDIGHEIWIG